MADLADNRDIDQSTYLGKKILVVDDEEPILEAVAYALRKEGMKVLVASNAEACLRSFRENRPDLLVLDVMLPTGSGFEVCKKIRATNDTPIILLTARAEERDKLAGLELGADDYMTKPFSVRELIARVKAVLRRNSSTTPASTVKSSGVEVDQVRHEVLVRGSKVDLAPKEFALLALLVANPGMAFSRQTLLDRVWGQDAFVEDRTIDVHIRWLRSKIEENAAEPKLLITVRGIGYKFAGEST